ncbi:MAG TPA: signal peptide peptidase SppA, partial [Bacteroidales bacterium]|nr:signal peptide peptidase SppA [Bacteroidales bacterium]
MKQFFKFMFASLLGFFIGIFILFLIFAGIIAAAVSFGDDKAEVKNKTILHLTLDQPIPDRSPKDPFANFSPTNFEPSTLIGLDEILESIEKAGKDDRIEGIYLEMSTIPAYMATIEEIRNALLEFKESGKFIIAYANNSDQKAYYLASVADRIYMNPEGMFLFNGLAGQVMFIRGTLEKLGIEAQVIRHGKFKSAIEPLIQDEMSPANEEQVLTYISALWNHMVQGISVSRNLSVEQLNLIADSLQSTFPEDAVKAGMLDGLRYENEMLQELADSVAIEKIKDLELLSLGKYVSAELDDEDKKEVSKDKIAVIFAEGDIVDGKEEEGSVGGQAFAKLIRKAREDEKVKAVVLRVNSPGGSSFASEEIHHEIELTKAVKPVVASYGGVAASGGYYISCGADSILASPNTITGSIGVFGVIPNMQKLFNEKLGITFDQVLTNDHADFMSVNRPMNAMERQVITRMIEDVY